jgi:hypothetical protein
MDQLFFWSGGAFDLRAAMAHPVSKPDRQDHLHNEAAGDVLELFQASAWTAQAAPTNSR